MVVVFVCVVPCLSGNPQGPDVRQLLTLSTVELRTLNFRLGRDFSTDSGPRLRHPGFGGLLHCPQFGSQVAASRGGGVSLGISLVYALRSYCCKPFDSDSWSSDLSSVPCLVHGTCNFLFGCSHSWVSVDSRSLVENLGFG